MVPNVGIDAALRAATLPSVEQTVELRLSLSPDEAAQLESLGGSAWVRSQLAAAGQPPAAVCRDAASDYLVGLAQAVFPMPVTGPAVRLVDALRKQRLLEAAVTFDDKLDGDGDRAIVIDISSLGRAEIERLQRAARSGA